jgi:hypothetical protein
MAKLTCSEDDHKFSIPASTLSAGENGDPLAIWNNPISRYGDRLGLREGDPDTADKLVMECHSKDGGQNVAWVPRAVRDEEGLYATPGNENFWWPECVSSGGPECYDHDNENLCIDDNVWLDLESGRSVVLRQFPYVRCVTESNLGGAQRAHDPGCSNVNSSLRRPFHDRWVIGGRDGDQGKIVGFVPGGWQAEVRIKCTHYEKKEGTNRATWKWADTAGGGRPSRDRVSTDEAFYEAILKIHVQNLDKIPVQNLDRV